MLTKIKYAFFNTLLYVFISQKFNYEITFSEKEMSKIPRLKTLMEKSLRNVELSYGPLFEYEIKPTTGGFFIEMRKDVERERVSFTPILPDINWTSKWVERMRKLLKIKF